MERIEIDARSLEEKELFRRLRDLFQERAEQDIDLAVLVKDSSTARRVKAFCAMSRLSCSAAFEEGQCTISATGSPCRCG